MWLINTTTMRLEFFVNPPKTGYGILSHTWQEGQEVSFQEWRQVEAGGPDAGSIKQKSGYQKVVKTCELARYSHLEHAWIDTCSIDKSSSAELSEAINSMFTWKNAHFPTLTRYRSELARGTKDIIQASKFLAWTALPQRYEGKGIEITKFDIVVCPPSFASRRTLHSGMPAHNWSASLRQFKFEANHFRTCMLPLTLHHMSDNATKTRMMVIWTRLLSKSIDQHGLVFETLRGTIFSEHAASPGPADCLVGLAHGDDATLSEEGRLREAKDLLVMYFGDELGFIRGLEVHEKVALVDPATQERFSLGFHADYNMSREWFSDITSHALDFSMLELRKVEPGPYSHSTSLQVTVPPCLIPEALSHKVRKWSSADWIPLSLMQYLPFLTQYRKVVPKTFCTAIF